MQRQVLKINGAQCPFSGACFKIHTILFNPKTVKSQIQGGDIFCKIDGDTNRQVNKCNLPLQNEH